MYVTSVYPGPPSNVRADIMVGPSGKVSVVVAIGVAERIPLTVDDLTDVEVLSCKLEHVTVHVFKLIVELLGYVHRNLRHYLAVS